MISKLKNVLPFILFGISLGIAQDQKLVIDNLEDERIEFAGFTLNENKTIRIHAIGAGGDKEIKRTKNFQVDPSNMFAYAWILDARTRELIWRMTVSNTEGDWWDKNKREFSGSLDLPEGEYEVYYSTYKPSYYQDGVLTPGKLFDRIFGGDDWWDESIDSWKIEISGVDETFSRSAVLKYQHAVKNSAIINLTEMGDGVNKRAGFSLLKPTMVKIYAIGEGFKGEMYDYGYIIDANTRDKIWEMRDPDTEYAGGAVKNRLTMDEIYLEAGDYIAYYRSDDNHSFEEWNANPPYDPQFWGLSISGVGENFSRDIISSYTERKVEPIIRLDRLGDYEQVSEGFSVLRPMKLRIYALGEGRNGRMFDYGWIEDARTGQRVWYMDYESTDEAGGAGKNRRFDGVIHFEPGSYIVHFITDDSHSYRDWNSDEPDDPKSWGIKIFTVGRNGDENYIRKYNPEQDKNIIVQLIRVRDDEHVRKQFTLNKDTDIRIYAIGEGEWEEMYDYAWIEDFRTGRIVWEMKYNKTRRAGGDSKNRLFDGTIHLDRGTYIAHYEADDSHAFGDWNASPPRDQNNWGITIYTYNHNQ
jgi:hypothetical protein